VFYVEHYRQDCETLFHVIILSKHHHHHQVKGAFTAAAPISKETLAYFASLDIPVYEVFGQSECTGPHTVSSPGNWKIGRCGRPMPGTESMISPGTGELCYRYLYILYNQSNPILYRISIYYICMSTYLPCICIY
jgi:long-subunit acyl-CoA synthetase (AMP-forming)